MENNNKFQQWFWFGLFLTCIPIIFSAWRMWGQNDNTKSLLELIKAIVAKGDLMLVCLALLGGNILELYNSDKKIKWLHLLLFAITLFLCIFVVFAYSTIKTDKNINIDYGLYSSCAVFGCALIICVSTILYINKMIDKE